MIELKMAKICLWKGNSK